MGVYEVLFSFKDATGSYLGTEDTHPYAQGFPLTSPLPGGPDIPTSISFSYTDLKYPSATGEQPLLNAIRDYYNHFYNARITTDNIAVFAGGRPAIYNTLGFLRPEYRVLVEETEYTPYFDALENLGRRYTVVPSNPGNRFRPSLVDYQAAAGGEEEHVCLLKSNPCNPTGVTWSGDELKGMVDYFTAVSPSTGKPHRAALFDEAYEFFADQQDSALRYVQDINNSNIFVVSAATKGLQAPGLRVGWIVSSARNIELFRNFSSIAMGGVARPSQICTTQLLAIPRVTQARVAVQAFYQAQREKYGTALQELGFELLTGNGGFYHWAKLPGSLTAREFNTRLFAHRAAILPGPLCDMLRRGNDSADAPHRHFIRFSFGPLPAESFENDIAILRACL